MTPRTARVQVYFTPEEKAKALANARRANVPLAIWLRSIALQEASK